VLGEVFGLSGEEAADVLAIAPAAYPAAPLASAAVRARTAPRLYENVKEMKKLHATAAVFRSHPDFAAPGAVVDAVRRVIDAGEHSLLEDR
jgi:hypothetical protein